MIKKRLLSVLVLLAAVVTGAVAQDPWTSGDCTVTLSGDVLTVSGTGAMADYADSYALPWYGADIKTIVIESGVTSIGNSAFAKCYNLESVSIPASVTSIGNYAFENCGHDVEALTVSFAEGSTPLTIGDNAFSEANLKFIDIPNRVTSIGIYAFSDCSKLESVSIPANVTSIGEGAFYSCYMLAKVNIYATSLTTYGDYAFDGNAAGRKIYVLPDAVDTYKAGWSAYAADIEAMTVYATSVKEGTEDAENWSATPSQAAEGQTVTINYSGTKKVKSIKVVKKKKAAPAARTAAEATAEDIGKLIGADGNIYDSKDAAVTAGTTAVAVIAYVGSDTYDATFNHGLAITLDDDGGSMNWSMAKSTCEGKTAITGAKWCLPSQEQWKQMFNANGGDENSYTGLNTTITNAGGTTLQEGYTYWSSTPNGEDRAYYVYLDSGIADWYDEEVETWESLVRACLAF